MRRTKLSKSIPRSEATAYAFGTIYTSAFSTPELYSVFTEALKAKVNYENRQSLLTWLKDKRDMVAYRYVFSVSDSNWKLHIEGFKRKMLLNGTNPENTLPTSDKPPVYDDTQQGGSSTPESSGAEMKPRSRAFRTRTKQYLKGRGK